MNIFNAALGGRLAGVLVFLSSDVKNIQGVPEIKFHHLSPAAVLSSNTTFPENMLMHRFYLSSPGFARKNFLHNYKGKGYLLTKSWMC